MSTAERAHAILAGTAETDEGRADPDIALYDLEILEVRPKSGCRLQIAIHPRSTASPTSRRIKQIRGRGRLLALAAAGDFRFNTHFRPDL